MSLEIKTGKSMGKPYQISELVMMLKEHFSVNLTLTTNDMLEILVTESFDDLEQYFEFNSGVKIVAEELKAQVDINLELQSEFRLSEEANTRMRVEINKLSNYLQCNFDIKEGSAVDNAVRILGEFINMGQPATKTHDVKLTSHNYIFCNDDVCEADMCADELEKSINMVNKLTDNLQLSNDVNVSLTDSIRVVETNLQTALEGNQNLHNEVVKKDNQISSLLSILENVSERLH